MLAREWKNIINITSKRQLLLRGVYIELIQKFLAQNVNKIDAKVVSGLVYE